MPNKYETTTAYHRALEGITDRSLPEGWIITKADHGVSAQGEITITVKLARVEIDKSIMDLKLSDIHKANLTDPKVMAFMASRLSVARAAKSHERRATELYRGEIEA